MKKSIKSIKIYNDNKHIDQFPYSDAVLEVDRRNKIAFAYNLGTCMRIEGIQSDDYELFEEMVNCLEQLAIRSGYDELFFCDSLEEKLYGMLIRYGFIDQTQDKDSANRYLVLKLVEVTYEESK